MSIPRYLTIFLIGWGFGIRLCATVIPVVNHSFETVGENSSGSWWKLPEPGGWVSETPSFLYAINGADHVDGVSGLDGANAQNMTSYNGGQFGAGVYQDFAIDLNLGDSLELIFNVWESVHPSRTDPVVASASIWSHEGGTNSNLLGVLDINLADGDDFLDQTLAIASSNFTASDLRINFFKSGSGVVLLDNVRLTHTSAVPEAEQIGLLLGVLSVFWVLRRKDSPASR